jgi:hypothetical protein
MDQTIELMKEISEVKAAVASVQAEIIAVNKRIDDALISQVRDHGKRISALEAWRVWLIGWAAGAGVVSHFIFQLFEK